MQNKSEELIASGILVINKPIGPTSHDIINQLRKITSVRKIGHAGTLDPFASGVLIVAVGRDSTKKIGKFVKLSKEYIAELKLGAISDTFDRTGKIEEALFEKKIDEKEIKKVLTKFIGKQKQIPPMYSAKKVKGKTLYKLARQGIQIEREPSKIEIYDLKLLSYKWPLAKLKIDCSSGTYIRSLAQDIGENLGTGAYLEKLERVAIGSYNVKDAVEIKKLNNKNWQNFLEKNLF